MEKATSATGNTKSDAERNTCSIDGNRRLRKRKHVVHDDSDATFSDDNEDSDSSAFNDAEDSDNPTSADSRVFYSLPRRARSQILRDAVHGGKLGADNNSDNGHRNEHPRRSRRLNPDSEETNADNLASDHEGDGIASRTTKRRRRNPPMALSGDEPSSSSGSPFPASPPSPPLPPSRTQPLGASGASSTPSTTTPPPSTPPTSNPAAESQSQAVRQYGNRAARVLRVLVVGECANCFKKISSDNWLNSSLRTGKICAACYKYEKRHGISRPESVRHRIPVTQIKCNNCGVKETRAWRTDGNGKTVCDECGIYYLANGFSRPLSSEAIRRREVRLRSEWRRRFPSPPLVNENNAAESTNAGDTSVAVPAALFHPPPPKATPRRRAAAPLTHSGLPRAISASAADSSQTIPCGNCRSSSSVCHWSKILPNTKLCEACHKYEYHHSACRPLFLIQRAMGVQHAPPPLDVDCVNCLTKNSPAWFNSDLQTGKMSVYFSPYQSLLTLLVRRCRACHRYEKRRGISRPESVWQRLVIKTRCNHCGVKKTKKWRTDGNGKTVCDECNIYHSANGFYRPLSSDAT
ncbi:hypothetical protein B0H16DRAFT_856327 [Mycena metata]|uniref:GATA-type domain-containing protein n=1 Tax=Mycena metata TaxID=1033252 RepID=A0AAD7ITL0_9AGAR|nr:hypothetical protein B0H16DRAFT_856327 [Mycena metata]